VAYATDLTDVIDAQFALVALDRVHTPLLVHGTGDGPVAVPRAHDAHAAGVPARRGASWRAHDTCDTGTPHMPTQQRTVEFLLEQMAGAGSLAARPMFGEYAVYVDAKVVALICDDQLYVKPTPAGRALLGPGWPEAPPYGGAKPSLVIPGDRWDDRAWLAALVRATADALPAPKPKKPEARATRSTRATATPVKATPVKATPVKATPVKEPRQRKPSAPRRAR
jgi:TfoX/Sxy family transcriptional regulator of competence genes